MSTTKIVDERPVIRRLRALGVDVQQLAHDPLPDELWRTIANVIGGIWGKSARWYTAAAMYGRFITVLKSGGTAEQLTEQFGHGRALAPILRQADMRELVLAANLPGRLNGCLADVVRRTRLTHSEKLAVAGDLIDQFHAGLSACQPAAEIVKLLGEPRCAAGRLRRKKLEQRSWLWHAFRWTCRVAASIVLLLAVTVSCLLYRYYAVHPVDTGDEIDRLDARAAAIPVEDRAWPLYAAGFEKFEKLPQQMQPQQAGLIIAACEAGPEHPSWPAAADHIAKNRGAVDLFLKAARKPRLGYVRRDASNNGWLRKSGRGTVDQLFGKRPRQGIVLPEISEFRTAKTLLSGSAFEAADVGDRTRSLECLAAIVGLAQHLWIDEESLVSQLVAPSLFDSATSTLSILLAARGDSWTDNELLGCVQIQRSWDQNWQDDLLAKSRQASRQYLSDMYSSDGRFTREGFELLCMIPLKEPQLAWLAELLQAGTPAGMNNKLNIALVGSCVVPFVASRDELLKEFDALSDLSEAELQREPTGATVSGSYEQRSQARLASKPTQVKYLPLIVDSSPAWVTAAIEARWRKVTERDGVLVAIACQLYLRRHDAWPASIQSLAPEFLETVPIDRIDGRPLRLVIIQDRPFVYSVGLDGKDATAGTPIEKLKEIDARDWQLFPPLDPTAGSEPAK
jgi:hypothetical protein